MKLETIRSHRAGAVGIAFVAFVAVVACAPGCGSYSTRGAGDAFVGTWSCPQLPAGSQTIQIGEYKDDSLGIFEMGDAGSSFCQSDLWTYSGSSATMKPGTSCLGGADGRSVITVQSLLLQRSGGSLILNATETVEATDKTKKTVTFIAQCAKE